MKTIALFLPFPVLSRVLGVPLLLLPVAALAGEAPAGLAVSHKTGSVASAQCAKLPQRDTYPLGRDRCLSIQVARQTHRVKAELGANFGVEYVLSGLDSQSCHTLSHVLVHPRMTPPDGEPRRHYSRQQQIGGCRGDVGDYADVYSWYMEKPWEVVRGPWTFKVLLDGKEVISETVLLE